MPKQPKYTSVPGMYLGGAIPKAALGDVVEAMMLHGCKMDTLLPLYNFEPVNEETAKVLKGKQVALALPAPSASSGRRGAGLERLEKVFRRAKGPLTFKEIGTLTGQTSPSAVVNRALKMKIITKIGRSQYVLAERGTQSADEAVAEPTMPKGGTIADIILKLAERKFPEDVSRAEVRKMLEKNGKPPKSADVTLWTLRKKCLMEMGSGPGMYRYVKPKKDGAANVKEA